MKTETFSTALASIQAAIRRLQTETQLDVEERNYQLQMQQVQAMEVYRQAASEGLLPTWIDPPNNGVAGFALLPLWRDLSERLQPKYPHLIPPFDRVFDDQITTNHGPMYLFSENQIGRILSHADGVLSVMINELRPAALPSTDGWPNGKETALRLNIAPSAVIHWCQQGKLRDNGKIGRARRFDPERIQLLQQAGGARRAQIADRAAAKRKSKRRCVDLECRWLGTLPPEEINCPDCGKRTRIDTSDS